MPLTINVGLSAKSSVDYQSSGKSINLTAELDQSLLTKPDELQQKIDYLYQQAQRALDGPSTASASHAGNGNGNGRHANNGHGNGNGRRSGNGHAVAPASQAQRRAIHNISRRLGIDPVLECSEVIGADLDAINIRQASKLIDHLKSLVTNTNNGDRQ